MLDYGKLLFGADWDSEVNSRPALCNLVLLVRVEHKALTADYSVQHKLDEIFRKWGRIKDKATVPVKGAYLTEFPEDVHRRMVIINGGVKLAAELQKLILEPARCLAEYVVHRLHRHVAARDEGRGGVGVPVARGVGAVESRAAAGDHHRRRGTVASVVGAGLIVCGGRSC